MDYEGVAVDGDGVRLVVGGDAAVELAVDGVVLHRVGELRGGMTGGVDRDDLDIVRLDGGAESQGTDAAKAVDANFDHG